MLETSQQTRLHKKSILLSIFGIFMLINIALLIIGNYFYNIIMNYNYSLKYTTAEYNIEVELIGFNINHFNSLSKEFVTINSAFGYELKGIFIKNPIPTQDTVILVHGIGKDKNWSYMKYGDVFLDKGYNVFVYDSRNHNESGGDHPSYGYYEKDDLESVVKFIKAKNPAGIIGIHGESLGAATALLHADKYYSLNEVAFYIDDCGYSDLYQLYDDHCADYNIPALLRPVILDYLSFVCKIRSGFYLSDISPINNIDNVSTPILFIHGDNDDFVPPSMAMDLYTKKSGVKSLYYAHGAKHANSLNVDKTTYNREVQAFMDAVVAVTNSSSGVDKSN